MILLMGNLPPSLSGQRDAIEKCLQAMASAMPLRAVYLFGSHARGDARPDSDMDLCVVTDKAERQIAASRHLSEAILELWPRPAFTLNAYPFDSTNRNILCRELPRTRRQ